MKTKWVAIDWEMNCAKPIGKVSRMYFKRQGVYKTHEAISEFRMEKIAYQLANENTFYDSRNHRGV